MNPEREYWRDRVMELLSRGTATSLIVIGWLISAGDKFQFVSTNTAEVARAWSLVLLTPLVYGTWVGFIYKIYSRRLGNGGDSTVVPRRFALGYTVAVSVVVFALAIIAGIL